MQRRAFRVPLSEDVLRPLPICSDGIIDCARDLAVAFLTALEGLSLHSSVHKSFKAAAFALRILRWYSDFRCLATLKAFGLPWQFHGAFQSKCLRWYYSLVHQKGFFLGTLSFPGKADSKMDEGKASGRLQTAT